MAGSLCKERKKGQLGSSDPAAGYMTKATKPREGRSWDWHWKSSDSCAMAASLSAMPSPPILFLLPTFVCSPTTR